MKQLPEKFSVYARTLEEAKYITEKQKELCGGNALLKAKHYYRFTPKEINSKFGSHDYSYLTHATAYGITIKFTFEEFKSYFEEESIPDFKIKGTKLPLINEDIHFKVKKWDSFQNNARAYISDKEQQYSYGYEILNDVVYIYAERKNFTIERDYWMFKEEDLIRLYKKQNNIKDMENKKIIGYKLTKPEYMEFANKLVDEETNTCIYFDTAVVEEWNHTDAILIWKKAGVLNLWFEPVYEVVYDYQVGDWVYGECIGCASYNDGKHPVKILEIKDEYFRYDLGSNPTIKGFKLGEISSLYDLSVIKRKATPEEIELATIETFSMNGQFELTIKNKRVYYITEDITAFVQEIDEWWKTVINSGNLKFAGYDFLIPSHNIKLMKTGCQTKETTLADWLRVAEKIK